MAQANPAQNGAELAADVDPQESREWLDALDAVIEHEGPERAHQLLDMLIERSRRFGMDMPFSPYTAYVNTIPVHAEAKIPGDPAIERKIRAVMRWNAMVMVVKANRKHSGIGGHIASYAAAATLYETGFNHFFHAPSDKHDGDLVYFQGHSAPGMYARSYVEGALSEDRLNKFREEAGDPEGLSSYPHGWLMPDYWQFSTVSMGIGPITAIYQARFMRYLHNRGITDTSNRKVWAFCGDGEMDEPESLGALDVASREGLDNLIFVVSCNLQRLDGPVRGSSKVIQELEGVYRGAGWNVIKVIWGSTWDGLLARDTSGKLVQLMNETTDGDYQSCKANGGAWTRENFFGKYPETAELVANMTDEEIRDLVRGGHDAHKVYAAYHRAVNIDNGRPTVILAKTVKGYGMGDAGEAQNITHQQKKMANEAIKAFRDRFDLPITDEQIDADELPFYKPAEDSEEMQYLRARREELGGTLPQRVTEHETLEIPPLEKFDKLLQGTGDKTMSTTMAYVRILQTLARDKNIKERLVPIVPDEARTFGMEGMFRSLGIYSSVGQRFVPEDRDELAWYKEAIDGQMLNEGITEAGSTASFIAAGTSHYNHHKSMIPFFAYYSMFGYQRVGDMIWAAADMRTRGFLMAGTAGRTTLAGEGLQHDDGHSHLLFDVVPNCRAYDPTYSYEMAVIIQQGLQEMYVDHEDVFYYITMMNENYAHPAMPEGVEEQIIKGLYQLGKSKKRYKKHVQLLGCGTILNEVRAAAEMLEAEWNVAADVWSAPSFSLLRRDGLAVDRWNRLHPEDTPRKSFVEQQLDGARGPAVAATDYMKSYADMIRQWVPMNYHVLGTDGFGRSDTREALRDFFEVDRRWVVVTALKALADEGEIKASVVSEALAKYGIDSDKPEPLTH